MNSNDKKKLQETKRIQSFISSTSDKIDIFQERVAESHLLLKENSFPGNSTIAKDNDLKRIDTLIDTFKKEKQQPQNSPRDSIPNEQKEKESVNTSHLPDTVVNSDQFTYTIKDLNNLVSNKDFMSVSSHIYQT
jgi:hypothetical protein